MSVPLNAEWNQEVTFPSSRVLFGKLIWGRKAFHILALLYGTIYPGEKNKSTVLNTFKHNLFYHFSSKVELIELLLVFIIGITHY